MKRASILAALGGARALVVFAGLNLVGLIPDVWLAHTSFWHSHVEAVPLVVSAVGGAIALLVALVGVGRVGRALLDLVALVCVATGAVGLALHLGADTLAQPTLHRLVYSAPILAPAAYAGLGLLLYTAAHMRDAKRRGRAVMLLAGLGLLANFVLCLLDHAQNGFWAPVEWISVVAGAFGGVSVTTAALLGTLRDGERRFVWWVLAAMLLTAAIGTTLHVVANLRAEGPLLDRMRYGAPVFAPALFADLAILAALGLIGRGSDSQATRTSSRAKPESDGSAPVSSAVDAARARGDSQ
jgi:hypothetical protein